MRIEEFKFVFKFEYAKKIRFFCIPKIENKEIFYF